MASGVLFSQMSPPAGAEDEFHDWYDAEHIPARLALPGFRAATRYRAHAGEPTHLAVYELDDLAALGNSAYRDLKARPSERTSRMLNTVTGFTRFVCELVSERGVARAADHLSVVAFAVRPTTWPSSTTGTRASTPRSARGGRLAARAPLPGALGRGRPVDRSGSPRARVAEAMDSPERAAARRGRSVTRWPTGLVRRLRSLAVSHSAEPQEPKQTPSPDPREDTGGAHRRWSP